MAKLRREHAMTAREMIELAVAVEQVAEPDRVWASDIAAHEEWWDLAVVLDLGSRRVVGWRMRHALEWRLARDALQMALERR